MPGQSNNSTLGGKINKMFLVSAVECFFTPDASHVLPQEATGIAFA